MWTTTTPTAAIVSSILSEQRELRTPIDPAFTLSELRDLGMPVKRAVDLCTAERSTQVCALRRLAGLPFQPSAARGLTVCVDRHDQVVSINRR